MRTAIVRLTLREIVNRRLVVWGGLLAVGFLALFATGFTFLYERTVQGGAEAEAFAHYTGALLTVLGLYVASVLGSFLALLLSAGAVSADADAGTLQAVLARPLSRRSWLLQRWVALVGVVTLYTATLASALLLIAWLIAGYLPTNPLLTVALMVGQAVILATIGILASTRLSTVASGVAVFALFGLAWLAGIIEFIGALVDNDAMINLGIGVSLVVPSDALWRGASYYAQSPLFLAEVGAFGGGLPFASSLPPAMPLLWWAAAEIGLLLALALRSFQRRDL